MRAGACPLHQRGHGIGKLGAALLPKVDAIELQPQTFLAFAGNGIEEAHALDEAPVAAIARVDDDDVIEGPVLGAPTVKWFVKEGDRIRENDPVVEVMTDKVTVQIPSAVTGKVLQLRAKEGEVVKVGATLVVFGEDGEAPPATPSAPAARPASSAPPPAPSRTSAPPPPPPSSGEALAAPAVRRLAKELNVNLGAVRGSGPQGRILEDDVRRVAQASAVAPAATISTPAPAPQAVRPAVPQAASSGARGGEERIPIHGLRKRIFEKMAKSNVTAAHFTYVEEVDMSQLVHLP